jgi:pyruvate/2-oxoglutarate dehydrogenase complex dihydrolipoamide acyltransferase (E2) component
VVASPYARKLARDAGVDIAQASGSGPNGRIVAADVQQLITSGGGKPAAAGAGAPAPASGEVGPGPCSCIEALFIVSKIRMLAEHGNNLAPYHFLGDELQ